MPRTYNIEQPMSNLLLVDECLLDARRVNFFETAIEKAVKPGDIVVDAGTGTGIIALMAAKRGAKVYAVERDIEIAKAAKKNIEANKLSNKIIVVNKDILDFKLPKGKSADVVTMEMLDTGLVAEQQAWAVLAMKNNGVITDDTALLPNRVDCLIRLVNYNRNFYGFNMPIIIQARNYGAVERVREFISDLYVYSSIDLKSLKSRVIDKKVDIIVKKKWYNKCS